MIQLGLDAGATRTKWSVADGARVLARGDAPALTGHVFTDAQARQARACLAEVRAGVAAACPGATVQRVVAGVTGLERDEPAALTMAELIATTFGLPARAVIVQSDLRLTYLAYLAPGAGILLYAGTGSIAYHLGIDGGAVRAGGYGYLLGDEGGALWVAREALRALLRQRDEGSDLRSVLARSIEAALGDLRWATLREFAYGQERGGIAELAPLVTTAEAHGDPTARSVLRAAAVELARLVRCVARQAPRANALIACGGAITDRVYELVSAELSRDPVEVRRGLERVSDANALRIPPV